MPIETLELAADLAVTAALDVLRFRSQADDALLQQWPHKARIAADAAANAEARVIRHAEFIIRARAA
jgi:hypothetical protein